MPISKGLNTLKFAFSLVVMILFAYVMVYADRFYKGDGEEIVVSSHFLQAPKDESAGIDVNAIVVDSADSEEGVIQYVIQAWDNMWSIARKFGSTISHLKKINNLGDSPIRPGMTLIITTEEDWFLYTMAEQSTVKVFADKYSLNLQDLMTLNYIQDETEMLYKDQEVFLNISQEAAYQANLLERPKPRPVVARRPTVVKWSNNSSRRSSSSSSVRRTVTDDDNNWWGKWSILSKWVFNQDIKNGFYAGQCTWYVALKTPAIFGAIVDGKQDRPFGGNARDWYANAKKAGFSVGKTAQAGAIIVYGTLRSSAGHVGKVISVDGDEMVIEDMNYAGKFIVTRRTEQVDNSKIIGYIYP
jgi:surface antigen